MMKNALDVHNALDSPNRVSIGQAEEEPAVAEDIAASWVD